MGKSGSRFFALICTALLVMAAVPRLWSDDASGSAPGPDVLVIAHPRDAAGEEFRQVIADAVRIELESRGLLVTVSSDSAAGGPLEQAKAGNAPVAIDCQYSLFGNEIAVSIGWYETRAGARTAGAEKSGRIGLRLDAVVLEALDSILATSQDRVKELAAARAARNAAISAAQQQAAREQADSAQAQSAAQGGSGGPSVRKKSPPQLLLAGGFAPFIATGAASYYFTVGYLPSLLASLVFDTTAGRFGIGLYAGMNYFAAQGPSDSSDNFLIPFGADVRYELVFSRLLLSLHLTGGPATLVVQTASGHTYLNVIPFLKSGIGAEFLLRPWLGISLSLDYEIYFEEPYLFMGITPSLGMTFRL